MFSKFLFKLKSNIPQNFSTSYYWCFSFSLSLPVFTIKIQEITEMDVLSHFRPAFDNNLYGEIFWPEETFYLFFFLVPQFQKYCSILTMVLLLQFLYINMHLPKRKALRKKNDGKTRLGKMKLKRQCVCFWHWHACLDQNSW